MKILVVDDEKVLVKGIKFNLESEGYQVEVGYDGEAAVELARGGAFDLIILDLMMPKLTDSRPVCGFGSSPMCLSLCSQPAVRIPTRS